MGRLTRSQIIFDGCYAHIISRFSDKRYAFKDDDDFEMFKKLLLSAKRRAPFQIYHYCLMNTHFHMAVSMPSLENFQKALQQIKWNYTQFFNTCPSENR